MEERRLQLQEARLHNEGGEEEEEDVPNGQEGRLDVIGEELSEKEEGEEETEQQNDDSEREIQDC